LKEFFDLCGEPDISYEETLMDFYFLPRDKLSRERYYHAKRCGLTRRERLNYVAMHKKHDLWKANYNLLMRTTVSLDGKYLSYGKAVAIHDKSGYFSPEDREKEDAGRQAYNTFKSLTGSD